ncbi:alanine racemase [Hazenella sp. IB182357]|uniref:Alanine racemase n=1 Tax=Polycladospora coralii TaxID=2771432 RepID=A0A926N608_9BACL|nr:alanine racemase [Polycladospora coralii]MBD1372304.1 alanine racemase [Polycladospora coralii]
MSVDLKNERYYARETIVEVNLDAIHHNIKQFSNVLPPGTHMMAVVKADGYGHGAIHVAKAALEAGATYIGVAFVDEGIELREAGIEAPILVLGHTSPHAIPLALQNELTLTAYTKETLLRVAGYGEKKDRKIPIHVKVDTGMGRIGVDPAEIDSFLQYADALKYVEIEGLYTHYATADEADKSYMHKQWDLFADIMLRVEQMGLSIPYIHIANSAGTIEWPHHVYNMVRLGVSMYGYYPSTEVSTADVSLQPALTFKSSVSHLKQLPAGHGVSYGITYLATGKEWIATVPVGYADGYPRSLSNISFVLVGGIRCPVIGTICMDQLMVDVTEAMPVYTGDEVVLYGQQGDQTITVEEVAQLLGTINYEIPCMLNHRIPRVYLKQGNEVGVRNRLRSK